MQYIMKGGVYLSLFLLNGTVPKSSRLFLEADELEVKLGSDW